MRFVRDGACGVEDGVEGADDELFLAGFLEDLLESEIDHRVDVEWFSFLFHNLVQSRLMI